MRKKMMLLASAAAALAAFAMPAVANAQQLYEKSGGTHVPLSPGAVVTATNEFDLAMTTLLGTLSCSTVTMHLKVTVNNAATSSLVAEHGDITTSNCLLNGSTNVTITTPTAHLHLNAATTGTAYYTFLADVTGVQNPCDFQTNGTSGKVSWSTNDDTIVVDAPVSAATCGPGNLKARFTLETSNGTLVFIT